MAVMHPSSADVFQSDLIACAEKVKAGVTKAYTRKKDCHWDAWHQYCLENSIDPFLRDSTDKIHYLQVFALRYRDGRISPSGKSVASKTESDAVHSVGQKFASMGAKDPRKDSNGGINFRLQRHFRANVKEDKPPVCVPR